MVITNSDRLDARALQDCQEFSHTFRTGRRIGDLFRLRAPDGTDADIVDTFFNSDLDVLDSVAGFAYDSAWRQQFTCDSDWHVCLAKMDAIRTHRQCDVDPIVDNDRNVVFLAYFLRFARNFEDLPIDQ